MKLFQKGWNVSQDGPGNRLVYHMQGCNMRCPWCSNPEGLPKDGALVVNAKRLVDSVCPHGAIKNGTINRSRCISCKTRECVTRNKTQGIMLSCFEMTPAEIAAEAVAARHLFHDGGGVTFSGGEPLLQFAEVKKTLALLKERGIHTAVETNACERRLPVLFSLIDYLIIDFKHHDNERHRVTVGVENLPVLENIKTAAREHPCLLVRITLIPGFNDSTQDAARFAQFLAPLLASAEPSASRLGVALRRSTVAARQSAATRLGGASGEAWAARRRPAKPGKGRNLAVEFLKYHEYGRVKWEQCGLEYTMKTAIIDDKAAEYFRNRFTEAGLTVIIT